MKASPALPIAFLLLASVACANDEADEGLEIPPCEGDCPELLLQLDSETLGLAAPSENFSPVRVGFFVSVSPGEPAEAWAAADAAAYISAIVRDTDNILAVCSLYLEVEAATVITLPEGLLDIKGNEPGSFGGHPPADVENPDKFNYDQNETLTDEVRTLFEFVKAYSSQNAIAAVTVREIEYYAEGETVNRGAGGLSFPPNNYHREVDYPARNSVLLVPEYGGAGELPGGIRENVLAHELGHMLLNSGGHVANPINLMSGQGKVLTEQECEKIRGNLDRLFGDEAIADPGPPPAL